MDKGGTDKKGRGFGMLFRWQASFLARYRKQVLLLMLVITAVAAGGLTRFRIDVSSRPFFPDKDPATATLMKFQQMFHTNELVLLAVEFPGSVFADGPVRHICRLANGLSRLPSVDFVWSMANVDTLAEHLVASRDWEGLRRYMLENPRYRGVLVAKDGRSVVLALSPAHRNRGMEEDRLFVKQVRELIERQKEPGCRYYLSGLPVIQVDFSELILRDQRTFGLLAFCLLSLFMYRLFRTFWGVLVPLACGGLSVLWTLGLFFYTGHSINLVSSVLSLVVMVISVANSIHLTNYYLQRFRVDGNKEAALRDSLRHALPPCLLSTLTTVFGFMSLTVSGIPAVVDFVVFSSLGIFISFILTGSLVPVLLYQWVDSASAERVPLERGMAGLILKGVRWLVERHGLALVLGSLVFFGCLALGIHRIKATMDVMSAFPKESPLREATMFLQENFAGPHVMEIMLFPERGDLFSMENIRRLEEFDRFLNRQPEVGRTLSVLLFIRPYLTNYFSAPEELRKVMPMKFSFRSTMAMLHPSERRLLRVFLDKNMRTMRVSVFLKTADSRALNMLAKRIRKEASKILGPDLAVELTGELLLFSHVSTSMVNNLQSSLLQAFGIIFLAVGLLFRSIKIVLIALIPNALPVVFLFGIMGWLNIPLTVPTSMVACIVLGLAVDDTIHFLYNYQGRRTKGEHPDQARLATLSRVGRAMIFTSVILIVGFWLGMLSNFDLIVQFGFLAGASMLVALWCDLTILPLCVIAAERVSLFRKACWVPIVMTSGIAVLLIAPRTAESQTALRASGNLTTRIRLATLAPEGTAWARMARESERVVSHRTHGEVSLRWYMGAVMGDETTMLKRMEAGRIEGGIFSMAVLSRISPSVTLLSLPFLFRDIHEAETTAGRVMPELRKRFHSKGIELMGIFSMGFGRMFSMRPIRDLNELNTLRVWVWKGDAIGEGVLKALGFTRLVPLEMTDVLPALQFRLVDVFTGTYYSITVLQWFPYAHYVIPLNWTYAFGGLVIRSSALEALSPQSRRVLAEVIDGFIQRLQGEVLKGEADAAEGLARREGMKEIRLSPEDVSVLEGRAKAYYSVLAHQLHEERLLEKILGNR